MIEEFNLQFACIQNEQAIYHLRKALICLENRRENRILRDVEGLSKA